MADASQRLIVITGATRGLGRAMAEGFAALGHTVVGCGRSAAEIGRLREALGDPHDFEAVDVTNDDRVAAWAARILDRLGVPDLLVNNAGTFPLAALEGTSPADFAETIDANLVAPFALVHALLPAMRARGRGHVVTVGSVADRVAFAENGAYAASKFGLRGLHEVLRAETRGSGVRATLVSPGPVDTSLWDPVGPDERPGFTPRALMLRPEDVAAAVVYAVTAPRHVNVEELRLSPA